MLPRKGFIYRHDIRFDFSRLNRSNYWTVSIWATSHEEDAKFQNKKPFHVSMKIDLTCAPAKRMF